MRRISISVFLFALLLMTGSVHAQSTSDIVINEINYNSVDAFDTRDWIELYNRGSGPVDLSAWEVRDDSDDNVFQLPVGTTLAAGAYLVVARDDSAFTSHFPNVANRVSGFDFGFGNNSDEVRLLEESGALVDSVAYDDEAPWPVAPDGSGATLELIDPALDNADPANWAPSLTTGGTPGAANSAQSSGGNVTPLVINEINYNSPPASDADDWIELFNPNTDAVDLSGWTLGDGTNTFTLPDGTSIASSGYLVLVRNDTAFTPLFPEVTGIVGNFGFALNNAGDDVRLFDSQNRLVDEVDFFDSPPWPPQADGRGPTLELRSPDLDNAVAANWQASRDALGTPGAANSSPDPFEPSPAIIISEINYSSVDAFDPGDWVELYNPNADPVTVSGWYFKNGNEDNRFRIPDGIAIPADGYFVLIDDSARFDPLYPNVTAFVGHFDFGLSGGGELIRLYDANGLLVDSLTYDNEAPWPIEPDGTGPTLELRDPALDNADPTNWAASPGLGGTPGALNTSTVLDAEDDLLAPPDFALDAAYPNPFQKTLTVEYTLPESGHITLRMYDALGRLVAAPVDALHAPGRHTINWSPEELSTGVYFVRLSVDGQLRATRRVLYLSAS